MIRPISRRRTMISRFLQRDVSFTRPLPPLYSLFVANRFCLEEKSFSNP